MTAKNKSSDINIIRVYDAPVKMVWDAWTDPKKAAKWWGPRGFTITTHSKDLRPGGSWIYTMHGPDGTDYPNKTQYFEVEEHAKLVYDHGGSDDRPPMFRVTVLFSEKNGKTTMNMTMSHPTPEAADETRKIIKMANGNSTWDRLAEYIEHELSGKEKFVINRSFDAPLDLMFEIWTNPQYLLQWLPPTGTTMQFIRADIRTGKSSFYAMPLPGGSAMYGRIEYIKVEKPGTITYLQQFCDKEEKISRHPFAPTWPETMITHVQLTTESADRTRVTVTWELYGSVTAEELATFTKARSNMTQGWTGSFDKLDAYLPEVQKSAA